MDGDGSDTKKSKGRKEGRKGKEGRKEVSRRDN